MIYYFQTNGTCKCSIYQEKLHLLRKSIRGAIFKVSMIQNSNYVDIGAGH